MGEPVLTHKIEGLAEKDSFTGRRRAIIVATVFLVGFLICGIISVRSGAFNSWDMKNYQYYASYALLEGRFDYDYAPAQIQTFLNPLSFVPFYVVTTWFEPRIAGFVMGGIHGLAAGLLFLIAMTMFCAISFRPRVILSLFCAALGVYGPSFVAFLGGSGNDNLVAPVVLAGVYTFVHTIRKHGAPDARSGRKALLVGGALIGFAAGLKLSCILFLLGCGVGVFVTGRGKRPRLAATGWFGIASVAGFLLSRGYWMYHLWSKYESPLFPFFNKIFQSPYYFDKNFADVRLVPKTLESAMQLPLHFFTSTYYTRMSQNFRDIRYTLVYGLILFLLIILAVTVVRKLRQSSFKIPSPDRTGLFLLSFFVVSYVLWQKMFAIIRYIVPLELLAPILIVVLIRLTLPGRYLRLAAIVASFVAIAVIMQPRRMPRLPWADEYIAVEAPLLEEPAETLVIFGENRPRSYLIPFFEPGVRFLGINNSLTGKKPQNWQKAAQEMCAMIKSHNGSIYVLTTARSAEGVIKKLKHCNLKQKKGERLPVISKHEHPPVFLFPVEVEQK